MRVVNFFMLATTLFLLSCNANFKHLNKETNVNQLTTELLLQDEVYSDKIEDFYNSGQEGYFEGQEGVPIYYKFFRQSDRKAPAIMISSGRTEAAIKYKELIFDLYNEGYSVYIHDHRGQGLSGRMTEDPDMGYIDTFQFYVDDMKFYYDNMVIPGGHKQIYLLAHSLGGAIGMTYLEQYAGDFKAAAFSSPMLGLKPPACEAVMLLAGDEPKYALGQHKYDDDKTDFTKNKLTGSKIRYERMIEAYEKEPKARLGGATYQWVLRSCQQFDYINENIDRIQTPFILFSAEDERIVNPRAHQRFVESALELGKTCQAWVIENAQHELLIEKDEQRIDTLNHILKFYAQYR
jgi:lysophospholipase